MAEMKTDNRNKLLRLLRFAGVRGAAKDLRMLNEKWFLDGIHGLASNWFRDLNDFERHDSIEQAYGEKRLTVKGLYNQQQNWNYPVSIGPVTDKQYVVMPKVVHDKGIGRIETVDSAGRYSSAGEELPCYPLNKTPKSMVMRCDPDVYRSIQFGLSAKLAYGLHDISTALMMPNEAISDQQFKKLKSCHPNSENLTKMLYMFLPLAHPEDQEVFQLLNSMAKVVTEDVDFVNKIQYIRDRMTRVKSASECDNKTIFHLSGVKTHDRWGQPLEVPYAKFKYAMGNTTDALAAEAEALNEIGKAKVMGQPGPVAGVPVTDALRERRREAALNYRNLNTRAGGELLIALRKHAGGFPLFTMFRLTNGINKNDGGYFVVGDLDENGFWSARSPEQTIQDLCG